MRLWMMSRLRGLCALCVRFRLRALRVRFIRVRVPRGAEHGRGNDRVAAGSNEPRRVVGGEEDGRKAGEAKYDYDEYEERPVRNRNARERGEKSESKDRDGDQDPKTDDRAVDGPPRNASPFRTEEDMAQEETAGDVGTDEHDNAVLRAVGKVGLSGQIGKALRVVDDAYGAVRAAERDAEPRRIGRVGRRKVPFGDLAPRIHPMIRAQAPALAEERGRRTAAIVEAYKENHHPETIPDGTGEEMVDRLLDGILCARRRGGEGEEGEEGGEAFHGLKGLKRLKGLKG